MKGEVADTFFIIQSGEVQVEEEHGIAKKVLGPGQFFGERSILQDTVRSSDVISIGEKGTMCYCLDRESFQDILGPIEDVWRWRALREVRLLGLLSEMQIMELVLALRVR
jgi:CRP-like cAMP-binding protein